MCGSPVHKSVWPRLDALKEVKRRAREREREKELEKKNAKRRKEEMRKGETTLNQVPFNQHTHNGGHKDNKAERASRWLSRQQKSQIYGLLGRVLSTIFKPQCQAPGNRDYTGKTISSHVVNVSVIHTSNLLYTQVSLSFISALKERSYFTRHWLLSVLFYKLFRVLPVKCNCASNYSSVYFLLLAISRDQV